ncbi:globin-coupled sensor protein [Bacillus sp. JJ1532]|uniref:globin-coupled sensor protein n=1 Tax=unclassified Bacillus (in: firmicutes) TaxID=185979 RepID=UPI002FFEC442
MIGIPFKSLIANEKGALRFLKRRNIEQAEDQEVSFNKNSFVSSTIDELKNSKEYSQLLFIGLSDTDIENLVQIRPIIEKNAEDIVDNFYLKVQAMPNLFDIIQQHSSIDRLKQAFVQYLLDMVSGEIGEKYVNRRKSIGRVHNRIGLFPQWYLGAYTLLQNEILSVLMKEIHSSEKVFTYYSSFQRLCSFDMQIAIETYIESYTSSMMKLGEIGEFQASLKDSSATLAASVEETTSTIADKEIVVEQMREEILEIQVSSKHMITHVEEGKQDASNALSKVDRVVELIDTTKALAKELSESSAQIGQIVNSIRGISNQTNILSLNAAIEAARAGVHGKGFSIVAQEVRKLAHQTEDALDHIQGQIKATQITIEKFENSFQYIVGEIHMFRDASDNIIKILEKSVDSVQLTDKRIGHFSDYVNEFKKAFADISIASQEIAKMAEQLSGMNHELADKFNS